MSISFMVNYPQQSRSQELTSQVQYFSSIYYFPLGILGSDVQKLQLLSLTQLKISFCISWVAIKCSCSQPGYNKDIEILVTY